MPWKRFCPKIGAIFIKSKGSDAHFMKMSAKLQFLRDKVLETGQKMNPVTLISIKLCRICLKYIPPPSTQFYYNYLEKYAVEQIFSQNRGHFD